MLTLCSMRIIDSSVAVVPNATHDPQPPWSLTGVTLLRPLRLRQSTWRKRMRRYRWMVSRIDLSSCQKSRSDSASGPRDPAAARRAFGRPRGLV